MFSIQNNFSGFGLSQEIIDALTLLRYTEPTQIQKETIPAALEGRDILGKSGTGTGKTAAFAIPICEKVLWEENLPQALILEPTRELAVQVKMEIFHIGRKKRLKVPVVFGGMPVDKQALSLKQKSHIVVGTPGRIMDHVRRGNLQLGSIKYLVIDEADLMLDMGFLDEVQEIIELLPADRMTMLFSATVSSEIDGLVHRYMNNPLSIVVEPESGTTGEISQEVYYAESENKYHILVSVLIRENPQDCMIFCATREMVNTLCHKLGRDKIRCGMLHGELDQKERLKTIDDFRDGRFHYLICTDVAARGIDFDNITHVINYDFPTGKETYVHRIGRTGRKGRSGKAISLVTPEEMKMKQAVEEYTSQPIREMECPDRKRLDEDAFRKKLKENTVLKERKGNVFNKTIMRLSIGGGRKSKMRAVDIVGTICNIDGISAQDIGIIDVRDSLTYVEILNNKGEKVLDELQNKPIKGKVRKVRTTRGM
ncbi:DEAD/DEAH box helicase [Parasporobacterium paucivorans]|uniref:Superfamily II DNA and RNA helicase n=1 Tax=Parasporobacterium paucivorans DSM 15970 TaxID=1122934 RepID=A0A1M6KZK2_9FIRM|nr:DEAD/DEAH box helicase [Parasporobacterium paucivorans]SHJ64377.1 Superfamily II DNA and RNA helicase [Parasporobacterium paucivorans DSM 15970]